ncbi:MAG: dethiobiotin synthase [Candidatus Omnitrophica bacterium]|nr:dethiobiotin synthase [Candidatus Omnitrophota bacterium]
MAKAIFITGTDTGVGKTLVTGLLGRMLSEKGINVITQKWVQTGCDGFSCDIAEHLRSMKVERAEVEQHVQDMVPYSFEHPSSPHLAAALEKKKICPEKIENSFYRLSDKFDFVLVEGAGGLMVPVSDEDMLVDIVEKLGLPILVVAENRLGAINQTVLTVEAAQSRGLKVMGIIFNRVNDQEDDIILKDNLRIVEGLTGINVLGELPYRPRTEELYRTFVPIGERLLENMET